MHKLTLLALVALGAFATTGCSSASPTTPTSFSMANGPMLSVRPSTLVAHPAPQFNCPGVAPFEVPFDLVVNTSDTRFAVRNITMHFVDTSGASMPEVTLPAPPVTLPAPVPTTQFGSALAASRDLPLSLGIGCGTGHVGTLTLIVATRDGQGHDGSAQLGVAVR